MIDNRQVIESYADCNIEHPNWTEQAVEDYQAIKEQLNETTDSANSYETARDNGDFSPQFGTGSPEGVVTANYSLLYIDTAVPTIYYNETFGADTGWIAT